MGRWCCGDLDYKFWFGIQPSQDLFEYGIEQELESEPDFIEVLIPFSRLARIREKVDCLKKRFRRRFKTSYLDFRKCNFYLAAVGNKDVQSRSMESKKWESMRRQASLIDLGDQVLAALTLKQDDLLIAADL